MQIIKEEKMKYNWNITIYLILADKDWLGKKSPKLTDRQCLFCSGLDNDLQNLLLIILLIRNRLEVNFTDYVVLDLDSNKISIFLRYLTNSQLENYWLFRESDNFWLDYLKISQFEYFRKLMIETYKRISNFSTN